MAFNDVDNSGQVTHTKAEESKEPGDAGNDSDDSYEELSHSLPMDFEHLSANNNNDPEVPDRLDLLLAEAVETDRATLVTTPENARHQKVNFS